MVTTPTGIAALSATCPLCHTAHASVSAASLQTGESWTCLRCGQTWTAARLKTVAAYERYVAAHAVH
jgi:predicted CXXCH cytochrome family protein